MEREEGLVGRERCVRVREREEGVMRLEEVWSRRENV